LGCGWRNGLQLWRLAVNILNKQSRTDNKGWLSSLGVGRGVNNPLTIKPVTNNLHKLRNRVLRRIFGPKRDEVTGEWRKLYNKKLHDFYSSPSIIRIIKSRRMR
jgi:hypothetical protein